jgi:hypothetical protein
MRALRFSFLVLAMSPVLAFAGSPCGLRGSVEQRIRDCSETVGDEFALVTRTREGAEIYQGIRSGVIWSGDLAGRKNYQVDDVETICDGEHPEFGGLDGLKWILPSAQRYIQAINHGIQELPGISERAYWTSTAVRFAVTSRYIFEGWETYSPDSRGRYTFRHLETDIGSSYVKCIVETLE